MDEESYSGIPELSAARRRGTVRRLLWPHGRRPRPKGFMQGRRWIGAALVLLVCALTVVGIAVFSSKPEPPPVKSEGNQGVLSLYDFYHTYARGKELQSGGPVGTLTQRLMKEPFEISAQVTVESEGLKSLGIPLTSVPAQLDVKYDLRDLGAKVGVIGMDIFEACVVENRLMFKQTGGEPTVTELPASGDVSGDMPLSERILKLAPYLPENEAAMEKLFGLLAQSVPEECTELELGRAFSPLDGEDVNVTLINTTLDEKALAQAAEAFAQSLKQDEALYAQTQEMASGISAAFGTTDMTLDSLLTELENEDFAEAAVTWKVYRRDETPIGFCINVITADGAYSLTRMAEFDGETSHEHAELFINDSEVLNADWGLEAEDKTGEISAVLYNADGETIRFDGTFALEPYTDDSYHIEAEIDVVGKLFREEEDTLHAVIDARASLGNGLGMLADSRSWQDINEWKKSEADKDE